MVEREVHGNYSLALIFVFTTRKNYCPEHSTDHNVARIQRS